MSVSTITMSEVIIPVSATLSSSSSSSSQTSGKRLRSCLSPTRLRSMDPEAMTPNLTMSMSSAMSSRSTSFSSAASYDTQWRRAKSVRWEGEDEGCVVTSYFATWSATEYDRTPLEPPSEGERACVLPERGSRCLSPHNFFTDVFDEPEELDVDDGSAESFSLDTPPDDSDAGHEEEDDHDDATASGSDVDEDREWEECMARRRMMFASMSGLRRHSASESDGDARCLGFDGYTSLSATLAELLKSTEEEPRGRTPPSTPLEDVRTPEMMVVRMCRSEMMVSVSLPGLVPSSSGSDADENLLATPPDLPRDIAADQQDVAKR